MDNSGRRRSLSRRRGQRPQTNEKWKWFILRKNHSRNSSWRNKGTAQSAQRAEVGAACRWTAWSWAKQIYLIDTAQVCNKLEKIIKGEPRNKKTKERARKTPRSAGQLERVIKAKARYNFKTNKKTHPTKEQQKQIMDETRKDKINKWIC